MNSRKMTVLVGAALLAGLCGQVQGRDDAAPPARIERAMATFQELEAAFPGVERYVEDGTISLVYGAPMTQGDTAWDAASAWLADWGGVFGAGEIELTLEQEVQLKDGDLTAFLFTQTIEGIPVDGGIGRVLVRNDGAQPTVVYGGGRLADRPAAAGGGVGGVGGAGDGLAITIPAGEALAGVQQMASFTDLALWTEPELIWHYAAPDAERPVARLTWAFHGWRTSGPQGAECYRFFVDAQTGALIEARWDLHNIDVEGRVRGNGLMTLSPTGPVGPMDIPGARVRISGGASAISRNDGTFTIPHAGTGFVDVLTDVHGPFAMVDNKQGEEIRASVGVTPPGPANLLLNQMMLEFSRAQVDAMIGVNRAHNLFTDLAPGFTAIDHPIMTNVNDGTGSCNAFFTPADESLTFFLKGGGCPNTAYSTVISHEYGHFVVQRLGLLQGSFGEGYSDSVSVVLWDTGIIAADFFGPGMPIRDLTEIDPPPFTFQCFGFPHDCGMVLGGAWWHTRENLGGTHGSTQGLDLVRELFVGWSMITLGGSGFDSAHPRTLVEVLTIDDDDAHLGNGTPNRDDIADAFKIYSISAPRLDRLSFSFPDGLPDRLDPGVETDFRVVVNPLDATPRAGSAALFYALNGSPNFVPGDIVRTGLSEYTATLPARGAFQSIEYYVEAEDTGGRFTTYPHDAPASAVTAVYGYPVVDNDFETQAGWTVFDEDLVSGSWERGVPLGWGSSGEPMRDFDGSGQAFLTENLVGNHDVDGGPTRLISPIYDLSEFSVVQVSYARWFSNDDHDIDRMRIHGSINGGVTWIPLETIDHRGEWELAIWRFPDPLTLTELTDRMRFRISVADNPDNSVTEAGFDRFMILSNVSVCRADLDGDGELTFFDFLTFQNLFAARDPKADFDGDGEFTFFDFLGFQNEFAGGCS